MSLFSIQLLPGIPIYKQVVYSARKAIVSGQLSAKDRFPSVRELSKSLKINPNTAQKVVTALINEGLLEVNPGIGTFVTNDVRDLKRKQQELLKVCHMMCIHVIVQMGNLYYLFRIKAVLIIFGQWI